MPNDNYRPVPDGECDTRFHIYDLAAPMVPGGNRPSQPCELADYLKVRERPGLTRSVVVQSPAYGTDHANALRAIVALTDSKHQARGAGTHGAGEQLAAPYGEK